MRVRTLFAAEPAREAEVRERIEAALARGQQPTPGGGSGGITVREKTTDEGGGKRDALAPLGKDKARV